MSYRQIRVVNPIGIDYMESLLLVDEDIERSSLVEALKNTLASDPNGIFVAQTWDTAIEPDGEIVAFVIAYAPSMQRHVFLYQAWCKPGTDEKVADKLFLSLVLWSEANGRTSIKAETKRDVNAIYRRWNFIPFSQIIEFKIDSLLEEKLLNHAVITGKESNTKLLSEEKIGDADNGIENEDGGDAESATDSPR